MFGSVSPKGGGATNSPQMQEGSGESCNRGEGQPTPPPSQCRRARGRVVFYAQGHIGFYGRGGRTNLGGSSKD
jgi:hypothetical protein